MRRKVLAGLSLGCAVAALVSLLGWAHLLDVAEMKAYDWRIARTADPSSVHPDIALVEINDRSIRTVAPLIGRWPWPRIALAMIVDFLGRAPARVIAIDLAISEPDIRSFPYGDGVMTGAASDQEFARSVARSGRVVMLVDAVYHGTAEGNERSSPEGWKTPAFRLGEPIEERPMVTPPLPAIRDAAAALGHNLLTLDSDGPARRMLPFVRVGQHYLPSLGVAAAIQATGVRPEEVVLENRGIRLRDRVIPLVPVKVPDLRDARRQHDQLTMLIDYRAPGVVNEARAYPSYDVGWILLSEEQLAQGAAPLVDPAVFKDKIVFVGLTASGLLDIFPTPFGDLQPGIQLHASVADSVLSNRFIRPAPDRVRVGTIVVCAVAVALMATMLPYWAAATGALLLASGWIWCSLLAFNAGLWLNLVQPLVAGGLALFVGTAYQYFVEGAEKRLVKRLFGRYVSKDVYHQLMAHPELAELGGTRRDMSVLFSDIRGFTSVTEKGDPEALVAQLNEYFSRMVSVLFRHHGTVDKFVGDMVMALFGAPVDDPDHAEHAVAAAVDMVTALGELNAKWASEGRPQLDIGIGVNSGAMIAGNIGSSSIMSYTVIGDNVNLAARLESLNKNYGTRIIIGDSTRVRLTDADAVRPLGEVVVKGKTRPVAIFEVAVPSPLQAPASVEDVKL